MSRRKWIGLELVVLALVCAGGPLASPQNAIPDDAIGLSKVDLREVAVPDPVVDNTTDPGEAPTLRPVYDGSPPLIPHGIADFLPITRTDNACIDCHLVQEKLEGEPTPIPRSHHVDLRHAPDRVQEEIVGARYNCVACHVPHTPTPPLVANTFSRED